MVESTYQKKLSYRNSAILKDNELPLTTPKPWNEACKPHLDAIAAVPRLDCEDVLNVLKTKWSKCPALHEIMPELQLMFRYCKPMYGHEKYLVNLFEFGFKSAKLQSLLFKELPDSSDADKQLHKAMNYRCTTPSPSEIYITAEYIIQRLDLPCASFRSTIRQTIYDMKFDDKSDPMYHETPLDKERVARSIFRLAVHTGDFCCLCWQVYVGSGETHLKTDYCMNAVAEPIEPATLFKGYYGLSQFQSKCYVCLEEMPDNDIQGHMRSHTALQMMFGGITHRYTPDIIDSSSLVSDELAVSDTWQTL